MDPDGENLRDAQCAVAVFACARLLADTIASTPWHLYERYTRQSLLTPLISQPCAGVDSSEWKWRNVTSLALRGNAYNLITARDGDGHPAELTPLHPDAVTAIQRTPDADGMIYLVAGDRVRPMDIVHITRYRMPGQLFGLSPIRQAAQSIGISIAAEEPTPGVGIDWKPITIAPEELRFLEDRNFGAPQIACIYGIPPSLIDGRTEDALDVHTTMNWTACIEQAVSSCLPRGQFVRFEQYAQLHRS
ncbi:phage portal protein [Mycolicibacterium sphagni]|uniref:phage portal protein n=1 Tax=Mycolicibacterium sphagni TaxID=1786 RepID=UPI0021F2E4B2|nr:phage portal protein [Mycolicibacterium sphagni]MCV7174888.1 phage portal protein [Mycolicibacterium sphagni]